MEQPKLSFIDRLLQKAFLYQKECLFSGAALLAFGALIIGIAQSGPSYRDFLKTEEVFAKWKSAPADAALFQDLLGALKKTPDLRDKYDALIAQKLIEANLFEKAIPFAKRAIGRLQKESPVHASFAETTLLIERKLYQEALEKAITLKEQMGAEDPVLQAHNLIRIACLQKELQNSPGEIAAWNDLENFLGGSVLSQSILESYRDKEIDLPHYISDRKSILNLSH